MRSKTERQAEDRREYVKEEQKKLDGMVTARAGRPGDKNPYADFGEEYWRRSRALSDFEHGKKDTA